jgi:hypothetical protein
LNVSDDFEEKHTDLNGYRQHPGYFLPFSPQIRQWFSLRSDRIGEVLKMLPCLSSQHCIGVQVGRVDHVTSSIHEQVSSEYYLFGIALFRAIYPNTQVIFFSKEKQWCQDFLINVPRLRDAIVSPLTEDWQDFIGLFLCRHKIISPSSFGWWAAWLDNRWNSQVMAPSPWSRTADYQSAWKALYDPQWFVFHCYQHQLYQVPLKTQVEIGGYYPSMKQPLAAYHTCASFRRVYPSSTLLIIENNIIGKEEMISFGGTFLTKDLSDVIKKPNLSSTAFQQVIINVENVIQVAKTTTQEYFILLQDDVHIFRALQMVSEHMGGDLIGNSDMQVTFPDSLLSLLGPEVKKVNSPCASGGSLFRCSFWASLNIETISGQVEEYVALQEVLDVDVILTYLCLRNHGTVLNAQEKFPSEFSRTKPCFGSTTTPAILSPFKDYLK